MLVAVVRWSSGGVNGDRSRKLRGIATTFHEGISIMLIALQSKFPGAPEAKARCASSFATSGGIVGSLPVIVSASCCCSDTSTAQRGGAGRSSADTTLRCASASRALRSHASLLPARASVVSDGGSAMRQAEGSSLSVWGAWGMCPCVWWVGAWGCS